MEEEMSQGEVYPNPTVKQVIFQIRYPPLFSIEHKIGDFQENVTEEFPESALLNRQQLLFADVGSEGKFLSPPPGMEPGLQKIWKFKSPKGYTLNVLMDSLDITSDFHKTYNSTESDNRFREVIAKVLAVFDGIYRVPRILRLGLRYIDECPVSKLNNTSFRRHYDSAFPLSRFRLDESQELFFRAVTRRQKHFLIYSESFTVNDKGSITYILDFDGFALDLRFSDSLSVADDLHEIISTEYSKIIKEPVKNYMRKPKGTKS
jgi:uncharacterized protein (TIGR04255 family)